MIAILAQLDRPETKLEWTLALVHAADRSGRKSVSPCNGGTSIDQQSKYLCSEPGAKARRRRVRQEGSMKPVAMHPALYEF